MTKILKQVEKGVRIFIGDVISLPEGDAKVEGLYQLPQGNYMVAYKRLKDNKVVFIEENTISKYKKSELRVVK